MKKLEEVNEQLKADLERKQEAKAAAVASEAKEDKAEEEEGAQSGSGAMIFSLVTLSATALSYPLLSKKY